MGNIEHVTIAFPNNTVVEVSGDPQIVEQLMKLLGTVELSYSSVGFAIAIPQADSATLTKGAKDE